mgnify:CR=1 FL=1
MPATGAVISSTCRIRPPRPSCAIAVAIWSLVAIGLPHEKEGHKEPFFEGAEHGDEPAHLTAPVSRRTHLRGNQTDENKGGDKKSEHRNYFLPEPWTFLFF